MLSLQLDHNDVIIQTSSPPSLRIPVSRFHHRPKHNRVFQDVRQEENLGGDGETGKCT